MTLSSATLTTTFTPSPSCTSDFYTNIAGVYYSIGGAQPSQCFPSGWASTSQYFSPGVCPQGYTQACWKSSTSGSVVETQATCCPSGYACYTPTVFNFVGQACASVFTSQYTTTVTDGDALTVMVATVHPKTEAVNGYGVSIRYNAADFPSSTTSSSSSLAQKSDSSTSSTTASISSPSNTSNTFSTLSTSSPTSAASISSTSTTTSSSSTATSQSGTGLSTGKQIGIGAGVGVAAFIVLLGAVLYFIRWRKNVRRMEYQAPQEMEASVPGRYIGRREKTVHEIYSPSTERGR